EDDSEGEGDAGRQHQPRALARAHMGGEEADAEQAQRMPELVVEAELDEGHPLRIELSGENVGADGAHEDGDHAVDRGDENPETQDHYPGCGPAARVRAGGWPRARSVRAAGSLLRHRAAAAMTKGANPRRRATGVRRAARIARPLPGRRGRCRSLRT